jgi:hypothetical protein
MINILTRHLIYNRPAQGNQVKSPTTNTAQHREARPRDVWWPPRSASPRDSTRCRERIFLPTCMLSRTIDFAHPMQHEQPGCSSALSLTAVPLPLHLQNCSPNVVQMKWRTPPHHARDGRPSLTECHDLLSACRMGTLTSHGVGRGADLQKFWRERRCEGQYFGEECFPHVEVSKRGQ